MTKGTRIIVLFLLAALCGGQAHAATRNWTGGGRSANASDVGNWSYGRLPGRGDHVVFGQLSSKDCNWDLGVSVAGFTVRKEYRGDVRFSAPLEVTGEMRVDGGALHLKSTTLTVGRGLRVGRDGVFDLLDGTLRLGRQGLTVDGGAFLSRGVAPARIEASRPGEHYDFKVKAGSLLLTNPAGTELDGSSGIAVQPGARVEQANFVAIKNLKPGAAALKLSGGAARGLEPKAWTFDGSVKKKFSSPDKRRERAALSAMAQRAVNEPAAPAPAASGPQEAPFSGFEEYEEAMAQANFTPYLAVQFNGGQHFFEGREGDLSGNLNLLASAAVRHRKLGRDWTLVPVISSQYQGTKQVTDLVGGGTLFQEKMSHSLALRGVWQLSPKWKLKPGLGYKWEFLKETRDESWGDGLFDYRRPSFSLEGEYAYADPFSLRVGYDFYHIGFVNFHSLESIIKDSQGNALARELAGRSVLDSYNHAFSAGGTAKAPWRSYAEGNLTVTVRLFPDQHVVGRSGDFDGATRRDLNTQFSAAWRVPRQLSPAWKAVGGLRLAAGHNTSNQNSYDAQRVKFLADYYDTFSLRAGVDLNLYRRLPGRQEGERPLELSLSATLGRTAYSGRQAQDASGLYLNDGIYQNEAVLSLGVSYPIAPHFVWTSQFGYGRQTSNQAFEKLYRYNFTTTNYRIGFGYEY
ncbi:MAG: hypothetical protein ACYC2I_12040 [Elusimicrobiales bacterium]